MCPATDFVRDILDLDESGYFMAGESTKTNVPGVFAAGDVVKRRAANRDGGCGRRGWRRTAWKNIYHKKEEGALPET